MKILHVGKFYPPDNGGIEAVTFECVAGLRRAGHEVDVICATNQPDQAGIHEELGGKIYRCKSHGTFLRTSISPPYVKWLRKIYRQYDAISVHLPNPLPLIAMLGLRDLPPLILHWHADVSTYGFAYAPYSFLERKALGRCSAVVVATQGHCETSPILKDYGNKIRTVPYGISVSRLHASMQQESRLLEELHGKKIVFSLGRFVSYKGFEVLIRAAAALPDDYAVVIGGSGPLHSGLRQLVMELGLDHKVKLPGRIEEDSLGAFYEACKVFCLPSVTTAEAFGVVLVEAMSFGRPVVATRLGNGVEWVADHGRSGLTVPINDSVALAAALTNIVEDADSYAKYSRNASERFTREFSSEVMSARLTDLYQSAIAHSRSEC